MSSQRGNTQKKGPPKHQNKTAFKPDLYDKTVTTKIISSLDISGVCQKCKDIVEWKIKFKKYKPLSKPKKCTKCLEKTVKHAYYIMCLPCATTLDVCAKCGSKKEIVLQPKPSSSEQASQDHDLEFELKMLPERQRRSFFRLQEQGKLTKEALGRLPECDGAGYIDMDDEDSDRESDQEKLDSDLDDYDDKTLPIFKELNLKDSDSNQESYSNESTVQNSLPKLPKEDMAEVGESLSNSH